MSAVKISWKNKFSNETGYVKDVDSKNKHFVNTYDESEAKIFANAGLAANAIKKLVSYGEGENNDFSTITVD